ncbi:alpha/beta hydrolase [Microvirga lotononidis]|uniref:Palmitoyl-protein thioesterase ABHD10, mitochondrial n=1 Tax=Microvirga lotononidis TaxID=864069 RepID=I4YP98_9HYPH|nr:alpha/beta hydrolase [Microvirga lotononidis]EIM25790.1 putative hydrolase or acyltransferase of alpha/beta superfamily [Microvirga lotononidis]WQO25713.1 alpha/beta hydrolase [Microvirga lotononidis]
MPQSVTVGQDARSVAVLFREGKGPPVVWLGGFKSDMRATKATALDDWAKETGRAFLRFDYSGHGESGGAFEDGTISRWLEDALSVIELFVTERPILVGSSMGGWISLLAARRLLETRPEIAPAGMVLIAPAVDMTERLMWDRFPEALRKSVQETGVYHRPSAYSDDPYPITWKLIEDGRRHLLLDRPIQTGCPVHILQGMVDPDVPWEHALRLVEHLPGDSVSLTLIKDGDHRLSRPDDIERLVRAVAGMP